MKTLSEILQAPDIPFKEQFKWMADVPDKIYQNPETYPIKNSDVQEWINSSAGIDTN